MLPPCGCCRRVDVAVSVAVCVAVSVAFFESLTSSVWRCLVFGVSCIYMVYGIWYRIVVFEK